MNNFENKDSDDSNFSKPYDGQKINIGGTIEEALVGAANLNVFAIIKEALDHTIKQFFSFTPAIVILILVQFAICYLVLTLQLGDLSIIAELLNNMNLLTSDSDIAFKTQVVEQFNQVLSVMKLASFSYDLLSIPVYAGASLMAMSHTAGIKSRTDFILRGFYFTMPLIIMTLLNLGLQMLSAKLFSMLSFYVAITLSFALLLICEKRMSVSQSMLVSFKAVNKKLIPITLLYLFSLILFFFAIAFLGIGLLFVLPFFLHLKGILYRNIFGITLKVMKTNGDTSSHQHSTVFDA